MEVLVTGNQMKELDAYTSLLERSKQIQLLKLTNFGKEMTNHISNILDTNHYYESLNYSRKILFDDNKSIRDDWRGLAFEPDMIEKVLASL